MSYLEKGTDNLNVSAVKQRSNVDGLFRLPIYLEEPVNMVD